MPRFVILRHEMPGESSRSLHWDLMLESGAALCTWAMLREPDSAGTVEAEQLPDHRLAYLDYEGPVSGDRGNVTRWEAGEYRKLACSPDEWHVHLRGQRISGSLTIRRCSAGDHSWRVSFVADPTSG